MAQIDQWINDAYRQHQAGNREIAEQGYRRVLSVSPRHVRANYLLGSLLAQLGKFEEALPFLAKASTLDPSLAEAHNNLGIALREMGRTTEAIDAYTQALEARPDYAEASNNLGAAHQSQGEITLARDCFARAASLKPGYAEAWNNLGIAHNITGQSEEAADCFLRVVGLQPAFAAAHNNLGNVRMTQCRFTEALCAYDSALELDSANAEIHSNRGTALKELLRFDEARASFARALALSPSSADALSNLASCLLAEGRTEEAMEAFDLALTVDPQHLDARWNRSLALLMLGDWTNGWAEFECRFAKHVVAPVSDAPRWDGSSLKGRTILVLAEQGAGDTLKFVRYLPLVKARGGRVVFACPPSLSSLMESCPGIDLLVAPGETIAHDVQIPLLSLPGVFGTTPETVPADIPYLAASAQSKREWQAKVETAAPDAVRVGLCWAGNREQKNDHNRSVALADFAPLADVPGVVFFSLQMGEPASQAANPPAGMTLIDLTSTIHSFADTAALMASLDLVITVDTSVAHLAGATNAPAWTLLPFSAPWHYLIGRTDSPWYPGMHLFQQQTPGDWAGVFAQVTGALVSAIAGPRCEALLADGEAAFAAGDMTTARTLFTNALDVVPNHARALSNLAVIDYSCGDYDSAIATLRRALTLDSANAQTLENMARCHMALGLHAMALPFLERALTVSPGSREIQAAITECRAFHAPLVSVVVPCYKQAHLLAEAVQSVVDQTYPHWELILVDDGSPDNTSEVARALIAEHSGHTIQLIEKSNAGLSAARNTGFEAAQGEYFLPLDSDDILHPQFMEKTVARLQSRTKSSLAYTDIQHFGTLDDLYHAGPFTLASQTEDNRMAYCALLRREMFEALGGYDPACIAYEDWDFWLRALESEFTAEHIAEPLFHYRKTETSKLLEDNKQRERFVAEIIMRHVSVYPASRVARAAARLRVAAPPEAGPCVSVVVPAYNQAAYLAECLESVIAQTHGHWEAIIVDDGSTDNTAEIARTIISSHPECRIRLITQQNAGVGAARNTGFAAAQGEFFLALDGDDKLHPEFLEKTMDALRDIPSASIAYTHIEYFGGRSGKSPAGPMTLDVLRMDNTVVNCCLMHRAVFEAVGGYRTEPGFEDWEFWLDVLTSGFTAVGVGEPLFYYRRTAGGKLASDTLKRARFTSEIVLRHAHLYHPARVAEANAVLAETPHVSIDKVSAAITEALSTDGVTKGRVLLAMNWFWPHVGGEERLSEDIGASLVASGFEVEVATRWQPERTSNTYRGMTIHSLSGNAGDGFRQLVEARAPEAVIVIGGPEVEFLPATLQIPQGGPRIIVVPCVTATGYEEVHKRPDLRASFAASLERADVVVCSSRSGYDARLFAEMGVGSVYVPNAVHRTEGNSDFRAQYGIPEGVPLLLDVSNLRPEKNHDGLLHHLRDIPGDWHLALIGCPFDPTRHVATHVQHLADLDPRVTLIPGASPGTIAAAMEAADLLLLPSHADATPLVLIEAMSQALPWIATPECGSAHDHAGGLMLPVSQFGAAIDFLLGDTQKRETLAQAGFAHWQTCYAYPVIGPRYAALASGESALPELAGPAEALAATRAVRAQFADFALSQTLPAVQAPLAASVIITTQDAKYLTRVLDFYAQQTLPASDFEVVVVLDGADSEAQKRLAQYQAPFALRVHTLDIRRGAAFARNHGLLRARGEIVLFLGDDLAPAPSFLEQHVRSHATIETSYVGVMGRIAPITGSADSVTQWVWSHTPGLGIDFAAIKDGQSVDALGMETGAVSLKRAFLMARGLFDPDAGAAPDAELSWRLKEYGLHFVYCAQAVAHTLRPMPFDAHCARLEEKGRAAAWMMQTHRDPEIPFWTGALNAEDRLAALEAHRPAIAQIGAQLDALDQAGYETVARRPDWQNTLLPSLAQLSQIAASYYFLRAFLQQREAFQRLEAANPVVPQTDALVSVVLPCFNYGRYLSDAIDSLIAQTYPNWEAIIVDDGSPDNTIAVANELIARYPERSIRLISQANTGHPAHARNRGIEDARGTYIVCLDADDTLAPMFLAECVGLLESNPRLSIAYTDQVRFYDDGREEIFHAGDYSVRDLARYLPMGVFACFRRQTWVDAGGWKAVGYEDWDFWLACAEQGHIGMRIAKPLSGYRKHGQGKYVKDESEGFLHKAWLALNHPRLFDDARRLAAWGIVENDRWLNRTQANLPVQAAKVSVLVTTSGRDPQGLTRAVESAQAQTYPSLEIIVAGTGEAPIGRVAGARVLEFDGVRSEAEARNAALGSATGAYIAYLTTEARYAPRHLETLVGFLANTRLGAAYADVTGDTGPGAGLHFDYQQIMAHPMGRIEGLVHRKSCSEMAGPFDTSLPAFADWEFVLRLSRFCEVARLARATVALAAGSGEAAPLPSCREAARRIYERYASLTAGVTGLREMQNTFLNSLRSAPSQPALQTTEAIVLSASVCKDLGLDPYRPCVCGSGRKLKFCHYGESVERAWLPKPAAREVRTLAAV